MEHYDFHATRALVAQHNERRLHEASAERLAREIRRRPWIDLRKLFGAVPSIVRRTPTRPAARTRPDW